MQPPGRRCAHAIEGQKERGLSSQVVGPAPFQRDDRAAFAQARFEDQPPIATRLDHRPRPYAILQFLHGRLRPRAAESATNAIPSART
jgi:hypothetical protein